MTEKIVDSLTEHEGKVHITTTVSIDKTALSGLSGGSQSSGFTGAHEVRRVIGNKKISMLRLGASTYLGLVDGRTKPRYLSIGDTLFLFVPRDQPLLGLAELVTDLTRQLPPEIASCNRDEWTKLDMEQLAGLINESGIGSAR